MNFINQIPIGQYIPGKSFVHFLDPRSKLLFLIFFIVLVFFANNTATNTLLISFVVLSIGVSGISFPYLLKSLKPILWIILLTVIIHIFMTKGGPIVFEWRWIQVHEEGVRQAFIISLRLVLLMVMASMLTLTTSPIDLTDGIESLLSPFTRFGLPAHELAMMMSIALRFIPTLLEETEKIMKAQISRGADFESGNLIRRVQNMVPLLIPLFVSASRRAEDLALAMEARGYRGAIGRTKLRELSWSKRDFLLLGCSFGLTVLFIVLKRW